MEKLKARFIIIDSGIPFIKGIFEPFCNVIYASPDAFPAEIWWVKRHIPNAHIALIVRTRTRCNEELLRSSGVDFIATATIGTDHIDAEYCAANGIKMVSAAGCNSGGVMQHVFTALAMASENAHSKGVAVNKQENSCSLLEKVYESMFNNFTDSQPIVLGVVGVGNVGSKVAAFARKLGWKVLENDPPKEHLHPEYLPLDKLLAESDIVTLHVPLDSTTRGMADAEFFSKMKDGALFINTSRGEIVDEEALYNALNDVNASPRKRLGGCILDVWRGEPNINVNLMERALVATPHIAGYSKEGKENGTQMVVRAAAEFLGIEPLRDFTVNPSPSYNCLDLKKPVAPQLLSFFDIENIDKKLRSAPKEFETLRNSFTLRSEFKTLI